MIRFEHVSKQFPNGTLAVKSLDLEIEKGEFFVLIGPSGSGKTTTLKMINRLIELSKGWVRINGKKISDYDIHELRWDIGYVLQQIALFPHMTIAENISAVPELKNWDKKRSMPVSMNCWKWWAWIRKNTGTGNLMNFQGDSSKEWAF